MKRLRRQEDLRLLRRVEQSLKTFGVCEGDGMMVGVSGGPDSVSLLHLLKTVSARFPLRLHIAHLDHGLRGDEALADAQFVQKLADEWKIPVTLDSIAVSALAKQKKISVQVAAREARYAFFQRLAEKLQCRWIALGHTADDQAETLLLRLLRGAGDKGLASIPSMREVQVTDQKRIRVIRPLLGIMRKDLLSYLKERGISYREDTSNEKPQYLRNRLRKGVIPLLMSYNPRLVETLCRTADLLGETQDFLNTQAGQALNRLQVHKAGHGFLLDRTGLLGFHKALQREILRASISQVKGDLVGITYRHLEDSLHLIRNGEVGKWLRMPGGVCIRLVYDKVWLYPDRDPIQDRMSEMVLTIPGEVRLPFLNAHVKAYLKDGFHPNDPGRYAAFNFAEIHPPFVIRSRRPGDYFFPTGMGGKRKKLQDFFVDHKIPQHERDQIPLFTSREGILWVIGWRVDGRFIAKPDTPQTLVVELAHEGHS